jgi:hypothetical protein
VDQLRANSLSVVTSVRSCCTVVDPTPSPNSRFDRGDELPAMPSTDRLGTGIIVTFMYVGKAMAWTCDPPLGPPW